MMIGYTIKSPMAYGNSFLNLSYLVTSPSKEDYRSIFLFNTLRCLKIIEAIDGPLYPLGGP